MQNLIPKVPKRYLLLIAGIVWLIAGVNILLIGLPNFAAGWEGNFLYAALAIGVFVVFMAFIFGPLVKKHNARILKLPEEKAPFYQFFDVKSYLIMVFMITGGITLRNAHIAAPIFIGYMYTGIGGALMGAGVLFLRRFVLAQAAQCNADFCS